MSLRAAFQEAAVAIRLGFDDVPVAFYYERFVESSYDPSTGQTTTIYAVPVAFSAFLLEYDLRQIDNQTVLAKDRRVLVATLDLPGITPVEHDRLVTRTGDVFEVVMVKSDPAAATWDLQLRSA